jgi:hypothetical protein
LSTELYSRRTLSPKWEAFKRDAQETPIEDVVSALDLKLKRQGGDLVGHCPAGCTQHGDGLVISPRRGKGVFLCRPSGASGDNIDLVEHALGYDFVAACEFINGRPRPDRSLDETEEEKAARLKRAEDRARRMAEQAEREEREAAEKRRRDDDQIELVLKRAAPIAGTQAEAYLVSRGVAPAKKLVGDLLFVPDLDYWGYPDEEAARTNRKVRIASLPAMVARVRDVKGVVTAIHQTYLEPSGEPTKWRPTGFENSPRKFRGSPQGGLTRLGLIGDKLAVGEGVETVLGWHSLGLGPEDVSIASACSLGNLCGQSTGSIPHPTIRRPDGKPVWIPNGEPDMTSPGMVLPEYVRELILLGDGDSERYATLARLATAWRRFTAQGRLVLVHMAPNGADWADVAKARRQDFFRESRMIEGRTAAEVAFLKDLATTELPRILSGADFLAMVAVEMNEAALEAIKVEKDPRRAVEFAKFAARFAADGPRAAELAEECAKAAARVGPALTRIRIIMGSDIEPQAISWQWRDWLANGKLHLLAGRPGSLKTTTALDFAASVTRGGQWPDGSSAAKGDIIMWSGEDAIEDTLLPRFIAAGGDRARIAFIGAVQEDGKTRTFDPARDMDKIAAVCAHLGQVSLIIIDPVVAIAKSDSHKNAETRRDLQPLVNLAEQTKAAVLGIHHMTKRSEDADPLDRVSGSLAFGAGPRVVMLNALDRKAGGEPRGVLMRAKNNLGPEHGGFDFAAEMRPLADHPQISAQRILWGDYVNEPASGILARLESKDEQQQGGGRKAATFLRLALQAGPRMAAEVIAEGEAAGIPKRVLQRALKRFGGSSEKPGFGTGWIWELPEQAS